MDLIVKGSFGIHYSHKLNLTSGRSGLILDVAIEDGNPADEECFLLMVDRPIDLYVYPSKQMAAGGGWCKSESRQGLGVKEVAFYKKRELSNMVESL